MKPPRLEVKIKKNIFKTTTLTAWLIFLLTYSPTAWLMSHMSNKLELITGRKMQCPSTSRAIFTEEGYKASVDPVVDWNEDNEALVFMILLLK